jgi:peptidyl-tRNA hydrolase, PTH1 family
MNDDLLLIVGLGNPGKEYELTRHNIGFIFIDVLSSYLRASQPKDKFNSQLYNANFDDKKIILLKPLTYMNLSGNAVSAVCKYYKIPLKNIIVIHDDIDLATGVVKIKQAGGSAGHNGLKSLDQHLGNNYLRIRIGVGRPDDKNQVSDYVLGRFTKSEIEILDQKIQNIIDNFGLIINNEINNIL